MSAPLQTMPRTFGRGGVDGPKLRDILGELRGIVQLPLASGAGITAAVKATATLQDAGPVNSLRIDARLAGNHGNNIRYKTRRTTNAAGEDVFDLDLLHTYAVARARDRVFSVAPAAVDATLDTITVPSHGLRTGTPMQVSNSGGGLPAGLSALTPYFVIAVDPHTIKLATTEANAFAGTGINITSQGTGTHAVRDLYRETYPALSMVNAHARFAETIINGKSDLVTVTDLNSGTADQRPTDVGFSALATGANEVTLAGVRRGDHIASVINITDFVAIAESDFFVADDNRIVSTAGVAAAKNLLLLVLAR